MPNRRNRSTPIPNGAPLLNQQLETELTELLDRRLPPTQSRSDLIVDLIRSSWTTVPNRTRDKNEANAARIAVLAHLLDQEDPKASSALRAELGHHYVTTTKQKWAAFAEIERIAVRIYDAWDMWPWQLVERNPPTFGIGLLKQLHNLVSTKCPVGTLQHLLNAAIDERQLVRISGVPGANYLIPRDAVEAKTAFHRQQRTSGSSTPTDVPSSRARTVSVVLDEALNGTYEGSQEEQQGLFKPSQETGIFTTLQAQLTGDSLPFDDNNWDFTIPSSYTSWPELEPQSSMFTVGQDQCTFIDLPNSSLCSPDFLSDIAFSEEDVSPPELTPSEQSVSSLTQSQAPPNLSSAVSHIALANPRVLRSLDRHLQQNRTNAFLVLARHERQLAEAERDLEFQRDTRKSKVNHLARMSESHCQKDRALERLRIFQESILAFFDKECQYPTDSTNVFDQIRIEVSEIVDDHVRELKFSARDASQQFERAQADLTIIQESISRQEELVVKTNAGTENMRKQVAKLDNEIRQLGEYVASLASSHGHNS